MPRLLSLTFVALVAGSAGALIAGLAGTPNAVAQEASKPADPPGKLTARSIELVDAKGRVRSIWRVRDNGRSEMLFCGPEGERPRLVIDCDETGPEVMWLDRDGNPMAVIELERNRFRMIASGDPRDGSLKMEAPVRGTPTIQILDGEKSIWKAP